MVQKVKKHEFEAGLCHAMTAKLCQPSSKWVPFFKLRKDKAEKGEGWALPFISCSQDTMGLLTPSALTALRLWETFTLSLITRYVISVAQQRFFLSPVKKFNTIALRRDKTLWNFGCSECNRVKQDIILNQIPK